MSTMECDNDDDGGGGGGDDDESTATSPLGITRISRLATSTDASESEDDSDSDSPPPPHHASSIAPGVALTSNARGTRSQNSSNVSGRLSNADGSLYPPATSPSFLDRSPPCIALS